MQQQDTPWSDAKLPAIVEQCRAYADRGRVADYIPELGQADPARLGVALLDCRDEMVEAGDAGMMFTLQSISKVFGLLLALEDWGEDAVCRKVGVEPVGDVFNSIQRLETNEDKKPHNPMINAGAIAIASMIRGKDVDERFARMLTFIRMMCGNPDLKMDESVYISERQTGDRNRALAYYMRSTAVIDSDVEETLDLYFRYNAIQVTCRDLARAGCYLARQSGAYGKDGRDRNGHDRDHTLFVAPRHVRMALAIMMTSGMYNASGRFAIEVGIPAKSGVSGGILAVVPGRMGIGIVGPAIDEKGNSTAGTQLLARLSQRLSLSVI